MTGKPARWEITRESLFALLEALDSHPDKAAERFELLRMKLLQFFQTRGCFNSEEQVDQTLDRVAIKILAGEAVLSGSDVDRYAFGVARFVFLDYLDKVRPTIELEEVQDREPLLAIPSEVETNDRHQQEDRRFSCLETCLAALNDADRNLVLKYHDAGKDKDNRKRLAAALNLTPGTLATRVCRIRDRLHQCVTNCMKPA
ncbi:MAG: hypothetical protein K1Y36_16645 [Blastocatellia bacterium]|nr:hypothetical protein [Blastocatellia bacterium]